MADKDFLMLQSCFDSDSAFESDFDEPDCADPLSLSGRCDLHKGFSIEIIEHPHSMRQVANIVIALHRLQNAHKVQSSEFTDRELFNILLENVIEERVQISVQHAAARTFTMYDRVVQCTICDSANKNLVSRNIVPDNPLLLAMTLKGGNNNQAARFHLSAYSPPNSEDTDGLPVCLGIMKTNLYLSCKEVDNVPCLCLEKVEDRKSLKTIYEHDDKERFLFLRKGFGESVNTFESVKYPGWFISTSQDKMKRVEMCKGQTERIRAFTLNDQIPVTENEI